MIIEDEEIIAVGALDFFYGKLQRVVNVEVENIGVEILVGAVGLLDG